MPLLGGAQPVYPRVCGGTVPEYAWQQLEGGLSPRVRGNPFRAGGGPGGKRSIPACAGEPPPPAREPGAGRVYPRVCGGTPAPRVDNLHTEGLSPRVRGNPIRRLKCPVLQRSIPACAGEPRTAASSGAGRRVYPRVCGGTRSA